MFFSKGLKNEFETAVVNEPSVFEPLKFYCIYSSNFEVFIHKSSLLLICSVHVYVVNMLYTIFELSMVSEDTAEKLNALLRYYI